MNTIILLRHSLTDGNTRRLYYGSTDLPINEKGVALCAALKESFELPEDCRFACTDLLRTRQTLEGLFDRTPERIFPLLREMDMGRCEMRGYDELKNDVDFVAWCDDRTGDLPMPGGKESINAFRSRILRGFREIVREGFYPSLIVCHGGTIAWLMQTFFEKENKNFYEWIPEACRGYALHLDGENVVSYTRL